jgi:hypothetical protein
MAAYRHSLTFTQARLGKIPNARTSHVMWNRIPQTGIGTGRLEGATKGFYLLSLSMKHIGAIGPAFLESPLDN